MITIKRTPKLPYEFNQDKFFSESEVFSIESIGKDIVTTIAIGEFTDNDKQVAAFSIAGKITIFYLTRLNKTDKRQKDFDLQGSKNYLFPKNITAALPFRNGKFDNFLSIHTDNFIFQTGFDGKKFVTYRKWDCESLFCAYLPGNIIIKENNSNFMKIAVTGPGKCIVTADLPFNYKSDVYWKNQVDNCDIQKKYFPSLCFKSTKGELYLVESSGKIWQYENGFLPVSDLVLRSLDPSLIETEAYGSFMITGSCEGVVTVTPLSREVFKNEDYLFDTGLNLRYVRCVQPKSGGLLLMVVSFENKLYFLIVIKLR